MNIYEESLALHKLHRGKIGISVKMDVTNQHELALAYSPGVASACLEIEKEPEKSYIYTSRQNRVAVISDGTAVLGLGDIGPLAAMPVMEGKALLMKKFADIDADAIVLDTKDPKEIIRTCEILAKSYGAINLEDISAPRCVEIERALIEKLDIPVFHDDQHGTSIVVLSGMINALKVVDKKKEDVKIVVSGAGAAGSNVIKMLFKYGFENIVAFDKDGCLYQHDKNKYDFLKQELLAVVNLNDCIYDNLADALIDSDVFIGMSVPNIVTSEMVSTMNDKAIIFALANPSPEISYEEAKKGGAMVVATGRSDYPNQINNLLAFPYIFRGALDARAKKITEKDKMAAALAIASLVDESELNEDYIIPSPFDKRLNTVVSTAVKNSILNK